MGASLRWPKEETLIPDLLAAQPHVRSVLDCYGRAGCGGPQGPHGSLRFFARAHGVPLQRLLGELRSPVESGPAAMKQLAPASESVADTIYRSFFKAGILVVLSLGAVWDAYLLLRIAHDGTFTAAGLHEVNAHGHAQIFGWVGLFVMGFAYQAFPRFKHSSLAYSRLALATLWMMLGGIVARSLCQPLALSLAGAWWGRHRRINPGNRCNCHLLGADYRDLATERKTAGVLRSLHPGSTGLVRLSGGL